MKRYFSIWHIRFIDKEMRLRDDSKNRRGVSNLYPIIHAICSVFISIFLIPSLCFAATFVDVPASHWAYEYIEARYSHGITIGCSQNPLMYCPSQNVTRGQMAAFLARAFLGME